MCITLGATFAEGVRNNFDKIIDKVRNYHLWYVDWKKNKLIN